VRRRESVRDKTLLIHLTSEEYEKLKRIKGNRTWKELLLSILKKSENIDEEVKERVNEFFNELRHIDPYKHELYELMRVLVMNAYNKNFESCHNIIEKIKEWWIKNE